MADAALPGDAYHGPDRRAPSPPAQPGTALTTALTATAAGAGAGAGAASAAALVGNMGLKGTLAQYGQMTALIVLVVLMFRQDNRSEANTTYLQQQIEANRTDLKGQSERDDRRLEREQLRFERQMQAIDAQTAAMQALTAEVRSSIRKP